MATITITKQWANGEVLLEADLDFIKSDIETFLNTTRLTDDNLQNAGITASSKLIDGTITAAKLGTSAVETAKINASAVTTVKIADANVTAAKLATDAIALVNPPGMVSPYAGASAPTGWLLCDGSAISRATYAALFTAISTTYGAGDGSTTFAIPDLRGRVIAGQDDMGGTSANRLTNPAATVGGIDGDVLGGTGGSETHTLTTAQLAAHTHTGTTGDASENFEIMYNSSFSAGVQNPYVRTAGDQDMPHTHSFTTASTGGGTAHNIVQPTLILNYIIKT